VNVLARVRTSREAARIDDYSRLDGELAATVRRLGILSAVGVPIVVAGRVWGAMMAFTKNSDRVPVGTACEAGAQGPFPSPEDETLDGTE
jgi:hypothetical protein